MIPTEMSKQNHEKAEEGKHGSTSNKSEVDTYNEESKNNIHEANANDVTISSYKHENSVESAHTIDNSDEDKNRSEPILEAQNKNVKNQESRSKIAYNIQKDDYRP